MKRLTSLLFSVIMVGVCSVSCVTTPSAPVEKTSQDVVIDFLRASKTQYYHVSNDLQKKDFIAQYKKDFYSLMDSLGFITNWEGTIKNIKMREIKKSIDLTFDIQIPIEEKYGYLTLECEHILNKADTETDIIYKSLYNIRELSNVYFDGFPRTNNDYSLYFTNLSNDLCVSYPEIRFWVTDIRASYVPTERSEELINACNLILESANLVRRNNNKEISQSEYKKVQAELKAKNAEAREKLTDEEKAFLDIASTDAFYSVTYSQ
jgi:hypothetical protein